MQTDTFLARKTSNRQRGLAIFRNCLCLLIYCAAAPLAFGQSILINHGMDGSWYNPASPGQGLFIETVPADNLLWGGWYTFDQSASKREWYTIWGDVNGDQAELIIYRSQNGAFNQPGAADLVPWGSGRLRFTSCTEALFDFRFTTEGLSGSIPLSRLSPDLDCSNSLAQAHSSFVSAENSWFNATGDWMFGECIDLGPSESHGDEVFSFDGQQLSFSINHYNAAACQGPVDVQFLEFTMQRVDTTMADLTGQPVIANRVLLTDASGAQVKQIFALVRIDGQLRLTHGKFDGLRDNDGYPNQLFQVFATPLPSAANQL